MDFWGAEPTATKFYAKNTNANALGREFVAYLFAHDDSEEGMIQCGSYTGNGSTTGPIIDLGFEPQWLMIKRSSDVSGWYIMDSMRGLPVDGPANNTATRSLQAQESNAEGTSTSSDVDINPTGFQCTTDSNGSNANGSTYIYMAIRRPNKPPESGTEVFSPVTSTGTGSARTLSGSFPTDLTFMHQREATDDGRTFAWDRLRGASAMLQFTNTSAEAGINGVSFDVQNGMGLTGSGFSNFNTAPYITYLFKRATGFFDVVAYEGDGVAGREVPHNLGVAPELMIVKKRNSSRVWAVWASGIDIDDYLTLNGSAGVTTFGLWQSTLPTATQITLGTDASVNGSGDNYIAYLFASVPGISDIGTYTGLGPQQVHVDCGFTNGARFVLIKRTDAAGDWMVFDTIRGITDSDSPMLKLNEEDAEVSGSFIRLNPEGFRVVAGPDLNLVGGKYIYMAIA